MKRIFRQQKKAAFTICMERGNGLLMGEDARMASEAASIIPIFDFCYKKRLDFRRNQAFPMYLVEIRFPNPNR